jgi:AraC-like DNA-binding protein
MKDIFPQYRIGHFINQPSNNTEFEILRFDTMEEPEVDDYHKHSFYEILWTESGESRQTIDYQEYTVAPNSLFFISPGQVHYFEAWKPLTGGTILFTEDFFLLNQTNKNSLFELNFLDNLYSNPCIRFPKSTFREILSLISCIWKEQHHPLRNASIIQSYLHILLAEVQRFVDSGKRSNESKKYLVTYKQFRQELEQNFQDFPTASFYANKLHVTPHHLNLICKHITGLTSTEVIRARSILEAKRLLTFSNMTITEIAHTLHFTDSSYFAKTFKSEVNESPQQFRHKMSEKYRTR